jgi:hypothetical protein
VSWLKKYNRILFTKELLRLHKFTVNDFRDCFHTNTFYKYKEIIKNSERFPKEILKKCCLGGTTPVFFRVHDALENWPFQPFIEEVVLVSHSSGIRFFVDSG